MADLTDEEVTELTRRTGKMRQRTRRFEVFIMEGSGLYIDDDDFHWDALLRVVGDFESDTAKRLYAEAIAKVLSDHEDEIPYRLQEPQSERRSDQP